MNNILYLRLIGGLGNQLFQIQYAKNYLTNYPAELIIEDSQLAASKKDHEVISVELLINSYKIVRFSWFDLKIKRSFERLFNIIKLPVPYLFNPIYIFENSKLKIYGKKCLVIDGFWQNKLFINNDFVAEIRCKINKEKISRNLNDNNNNIVCVHIRRGDYLTNKRFFVRQQSVLPIEYYQKAFLYFIEQDVSCKFHIYTDDEDWARYAFSDQPRAIIVETKKMNAFTILLKMSSYSKYVIANSTLSWWAAVLSSVNDKKVVLPKFWGINQSAEHLRLDGWHAL